MENYKVFYTNNAVVSCKPTEVRMPDGHVGDVFIQYDEDNKSVIYALIRASTHEEALLKATEILRETGPK